MSKAGQVALGGVLAALGVVILMLDSVITVAGWCTAMIAGVLTLVVRDKCGSRMAWAYWGAVSILGLLLSGDKESACLYVCAMGWYPLVKPRLDSIRVRPLRWGAKGLLFAGLLGLTYGLLGLLIGWNALAAEFRGMGRILLLTTAGMMFQVLGLYDVALLRLEKNGKVLLQRLRSRRK